MVGVCKQNVPRDDATAFSFNTDALLPARSVSFGSNQNVKKRQLGVLEKTKILSSSFKVPPNSKVRLSFVSSGIFVELRFEFVSKRGFLGKETNIGHFYSPRLSVAW